MAVYRRESRRRPIIALIVITSLALISLDRGGNGVIATVRHTARDAIAPVQGVVSDAFNPVSNVFDGVTKVHGLEDENAKLRSRVSTLEGKLSRERGVGEEYSQITRLLDIPDVEDVTGVVARVIGGPAGNFERTLTLNKGTSKGIVIGMPIVAGDGLVGKVTDASRTRATVTLIDSPGLGVGVRTEKSREQAVTQGRSGEKLLRLSFIGNPRAEIAEGELVFTAGVEGAAYPPDVPVARVVKIDRQRGVLDPDIFVEPLVDLDKLIFVKALRWPPRDTSPAGDSGTSGN
ncbi:MAG: rod shape-determining protein MreC [Acidimicrobiia bacterium]|jgi:rod shape-determining protein MreC